MFLCNIYVFLKEDDLWFIYIKRIIVIVDLKIVFLNVVLMIVLVGVVIMYIFFLFKKSI